MSAIQGSGLEEFHSNCIQEDTHVLVVVNR